MPGGRCMVPGCVSRAMLNHEKRPGVEYPSMFSFPMRGESAAWLEFCGLRPDQLEEVRKKGRSVCSIHFRDRDINRVPARPRVIPGAVPVIRPPGDLDGRLARQKLDASELEEIGSSSWGSRYGMTDPLATPASASVVIDDRMEEEEEADDSETESCEEDVADIGEANRAKMEARKREREEGRQARLKPTLYGIHLQPEIAKLNWGGGSNGVLDSMGDFLVNCIFTDVVFVCGRGDEQRRMEAHQAVMEGHSPFLGKVFSSTACSAGCRTASDDKQLVVLPDISPVAMRRLLDFLYTGRVVLRSPDERDDFIFAAATLDLQFPDDVLAAMYDDLKIKTDEKKTDGDAEKIQKKEDDVVEKVEEDKKKKATEADKSTDDIVVLEESMEEAAGGDEDGSEEEEAIVPDDGGGGFEDEGNDDKLNNGGDGDGDGSGDGGDETVKDQAEERDEEGGDKRPLDGDEGGTADDVQLHNVDARVDEAVKDNNVEKTGEDGGKKRALDEDGDESGGPPPPPPEKRPRIQPEEKKEREEPAEKCALG